MANNSLDQRIEEGLRRAEHWSAYMRELKPYKLRRGFVMKFRSWEEKEAWETAENAADLELGQS